MKALLQRVTQARVEIDGRTAGEIGAGMLVFLGVDAGDSPASAEKLAERVMGYRIFADSEDKMNLSLVDVEQDMLVVSQVTLSADTSKGRRPGFSSGASPEQANALYQHFVDVCRGRLPCVETGEFGADMQVQLVNDGPVTFLLESS